MIFTDKYRHYNMISWNINNICNFDCDFCNNRGTVGLIDEQGKDLLELKKGFENIGKDWIIHISGGEPFLEKDIIPICKMISKNHYISLNTNLSTSNVYDFADSIDPGKVLFVSASVHILEREKSDPQLSKFIAKIKYLQSKDFNVIATYVTHPSLFHRISDDFKILLLGGVNKVRIKTFRGVLNGKVYPFSYSEEDISFLSSFESDYPELKILKGQNSFYGNECAAGERSFVMDEEGNLKRCSRINRKYGNLFKGDFIRDHVPRPCPLKHCRCPYEGIRNAISCKSSSSLFMQEVLTENFLQFKRIIKDPNLLLKLNNKIKERFKSG